MDTNKVGPMDTGKKLRAKAATDIAEWEHNHFYLKCANHTMVSYNIK